MRIILYNIKRIFCGKFNLLLFMLPIIAISIFLMVFNITISKTSNDKIFDNCRVGIVDLDKTEYTTELRNYLDEKYNVSLINEEDVEHYLVKNKVNYSITFYKGITDDLIQGKGVKLEGKSLNSSDLFKFFNTDLNHKLREATAIGYISKDSSEFYNKLSEIEDGNFNVESNQVVIGEKLNNLNSIIVVFFGFLIFFLIYFNCNMGSRVLEDKLTNKITRISTTGWKYSKYLSMILLSQFILGLIQVGIIFTLLKVLGNEQITKLLNINIFIILILSNLIGLSLGVLIATLSKNKNMFLAILNIAINIIAMLGGLYWPLDVMPEFAIFIAKFTPTYWIRTALNMALEGRGISNYMINIMMVILFVFAFMFISSIKGKKGRIKLNKERVTLNE